MATGMMKWRFTGVVTAIAMAAVMVLTACQSDTTENSSKNAEIGGDCLVLESSHIEKSYGEIVDVKGQVRNQCDHSIDYVEITIALFDDSGNQIVTMQDNVADLQSKTVWRFWAQAY